MKINLLFLFLNLIAFGQIHKGIVVDENGKPIENVTITNPKLNIYSHTNETASVEEIHFTPGTPFFLKLGVTYKF